MDHMEISQAALLVFKLHPKKQVIKQESTEVCLRVLFKGQIPLPHFHPQTQACPQANPLRDGLVTIKNHHRHISFQGTAQLSEPWDIIWKDNVVKTQIR